MSRIHDSLRAPDMHGDSGRKPIAQARRKQHDEALLDQELLAARAAIESLQKQNAELETRFAKKEDTLTGRVRALESRAEKAVSELEVTQHEMTRQKEALKEQARESKTEIRDLSAQIDRLSKQLRAAEQAQASAESEQTKLHEALDAAEQARTNDAKAHQEALQIRREKETLSESLTAAEDARTMLEQERDALKAEIGELAKDIQGEQTVAAKLKKKADEQAAAIKTQASEIAEDGDRLAKIEAERDEFAARMAALQESLDAQQASMATVQADRDDVAARMAALHSERDAMRVRLDETTGNLTELDDLRRQLGQLKTKLKAVQGASADQQLQLQRRVNDLEKEREALKTTHTQVCHQFEEARSAGEAQAAALIKERDAARKRTAALTQAISEAKAQHIALKDAAGQQKQTLGQRLRVLQDDAISTTSMIEQAQAEMDKYRERSAELEQQVKSQQQDLDGLRKQTEADKASLAEAESIRRRDLAALKQELTTAKAASAERTNQTDALPHAGKERERALLEQIEALHHERDTSTETLAALRKEIQDIRVSDAEQVRELQERIQALKAELDTRPAPPGPEDWHLKLDDGSIFGPVPIEELVSWAADCRIGPDHSVSTDREHWQRAGDVPPLRMDWTVTLVDGTEYGPVHLLAVRHLVADGSVAADSTVHNRRTEAHWPVSQVLTDAVVALVETNRRLTDALTDRDTRLTVLEQRLRALEGSPVPAASPPAAPPKSVIDQIRRARG